MNMVDLSIKYILYKKSNVTGVLCSISHVPNKGSYVTIVPFSMA